jgi:hypothetical protein
MDSGDNGYDGYNDEQVRTDFYLSHRKLTKSNHRRSYFMST